VRRDARDAAAPANGGTAEAGPERPGEVRTGRRRWRRASPASWTAGNGGERAARRTGAAAGEGERRWPCRGGEGAVLAPESEEEGEEKLSPRGIETALTGDGESRRRRELGRRGNGGWGKRARV